MAKASITMRIATAKKISAKKETMLSWSTSIARQTDELTSLAWKAASENDIAGVTEYLKELNYLIQRSMDAVPRITDELLKSTPEMTGDEMKFLDEMAEKRGISRAELMREMLDEFLKKQAKSEKRREKMKSSSENFVKIEKFSENEN